MALSAAGRQIYVCAADAGELLRAVPLPAAIAERIVAPAEFVALYRRGKIGAAVADRSAQTSELRRMLVAERSSSSVPVIELSPILVERPRGGESWADVIVPREHAHLALMPAIRRCAVARVLNAVGAAMRTKFSPTLAAEVARCSIPTRLPSFHSVEAVAEFGNCVVSTLGRCWARCSKRGGRLLTDVRRRRRCTRLSLGRCSFAL